MKKLLATTLVLIFGAGAAQAETYGTNIPGVLVKHVECKFFTGRLLFSLVNRSNTSRENIRVIVESIDPDGDSVDRATSSTMRITPGQGSRHSLHVSCHLAQTYRFTISE